MADEATPTPAGSTTISEGSSCFFEEEFVLMGVIFLCDAKSLGKLRMTKKDLSAGLLTDPKTFKWISSLKGFPLQLLSSSQKSEVSLAERLRIAETLATLENSIPRSPLVLAFLKKTCVLGRFYRVTLVDYSVENRRPSKKIFCGDVDALVLR